MRTIIYKTSKFLTVILICLTGAYASPAFAFYDDVESSIRNLLGMTSVDFELSDTTLFGDLGIMQIVDIVNVGKTNPIIDIEIKSIVKNKGEFCEELDLRVVQGANILYEGALLSFAVPTLLENDSNLELIVTLKGDADVHENGTGTCQLEYEFDGRIPGYPKGEGFIDKEKILSPLFEENNGGGTNPLYPAPEPEEENFIEQCKNGGWVKFTEDPYNLPFKNQGHCVSHFASGGTSTEARTGETYPTNFSEPQTQEENESQVTSEPNETPHRDETDELKLLKEKANKPDDDQKAKAEHQKDAKQKKKKNEPTATPEAGDKIVGLEVSMTSTIDVVDDVAVEEVSEPVTPQTNVMVGQEIYPTSE